MSLACCLRLNSRCGRQGRAHPCACMTALQQCARHSCSWKVGRCVLIKRCMPACIKQQARHAARACMLLWPRCTAPDAQPAGAVHTRRASCTTACSRAWRRRRRTSTATATARWRCIPPSTPSPRPRCPARATTSTSSPGPTPARRPPVRHHEGFRAASFMLCSAL
jgi:hypothetical protein